MKGLQVSSAEQEVSCSGSSMQGHFDAIAELINSNSISNADRQVPLLISNGRHLSDAMPCHFGTIAQLINTNSIPNADRQVPLQPGDARNVGDAMLRVDCPIAVSYAREQGVCDLQRTGACPCLLSHTKLALRHLHASSHGVLRLGR